MVACCSPSDRYLPETTSTLQFATKGIFENFHLDSLDFHTFTFCALPAANISKTEVAILSPHEQEVRSFPKPFHTFSVHHFTSPIFFVFCFLFFGGMCVCLLCACVCVLNRS